MSWLEAENARKNSYNSMVKSAIDKHIIYESQATDRPKLHTLMEQLIRDFENTEGYIGDFPTMADMLQSWESFLVLKIANPYKEDSIEKLSLSITQHYGKVSISIGMEDSFVIASPSDRHAALAHMRLLIDEAHIEQQRSIHLAVTQAPHSATAGGEIVIQVTGIRKSNERGKDILRVLGDKYSQHGVSLYNEVAERAGINISQLAYGDNRFDGKAVVLLRENGNPQKVVSIE